MASKKLLCFLFVYFFTLGSATYCNDDSDCSLSESCCSHKVCRQTCYNCSYDYQCGRNAAIANASVVRLLVTVRTTPIVALERIVVGESVIHHSVVGAVELNSHTLDDATSTCSSDGELQSSWLQPASSRL